MSPSFFLFLHLCCHHVEIFMHALGQHLGIAHRLPDIRVTKHPLQILDLHALSEHICRKCMPCQVCVHLCGDIRHRTDYLQKMVVIGVVDFRHRPSVLLQHRHRRRQQTADISNTRLDTLSCVYLLTFHFLILAEIECLGVRI